MTKAELYYEFLKEEGYVPHIDSDGDVLFKAEGLSYLLFAAEDDPTYFRLAMPFFWEIESPAERQRVLAAAAVVNSEVKVVKLYVVEDHAWAAVEMLIDPPENFKPIFARALRLLRHGVQRFSEIMNTPVQ